MLLLAPTRELAEQIHREAERLSAGRRFRLGIVKKSVASSSALEGQVQCQLYVSLFSDCTSLHGGTYLFCGTSVCRTIMPILSTTCW